MSDLSIKIPSLNLKPAIVPPSEAQTPQTSNVSVYLRVRPFSYDEALIEKAQHEVELKPIVTLQNTNEVVLHHPSLKSDASPFKFDGILWSIPEWQCPLPHNVTPASQQDVFEVASRPLVDSLFEGYNCCIFAYGQTGSGKTHTTVGDIQEPGLIPRTCDEVFRRISHNKQKDISHTVSVTFYEIYNEQVFDLLVSSPVALRVRQDPKTGPFVEGLKCVPVRSSAECWALVGQGLLQRSVAETNCNLRSSRSHAIFQLTIQRVEELSLPTATPGRTSMRSPTGSIEPLRSTRISRVSMADLAGVEKSEVSGVQGARLVETNYINLSLTTLRKVIDALIERSKGKKIVPPYRESILTWLLSEDIGGNCKTTMVACVGPHKQNAEETLSTLRYAMKARGIRMKAHVNEDTTAALIRELREEVSRMQMELAQGVSHLALPSLSLNNNGEVMEWNTTANQLLAIDKGIHVKDLLKCPAYENVEHAISATNAPNWTFSYTKTKEGDRAYVASCIVRLGDILVCMMRDASEDFTVRQQNAIHQQVIDFSPIPLLTIDGRGTIMMANLECAKFFQTSKESMLGQNVNEFCKGKIFHDWESMGTFTVSIWIRDREHSAVVTIKPFETTEALEASEHYMIYFASVKDKEFLEKSGLFPSPQSPRHVTPTSSSKKEAWRKKAMSVSVMNPMTWAAEVEDGGDLPSPRCLDGPQTPLFFTSVQFEDEHLKSTNEKLEKENTVLKEKVKVLEQQVRLARFREPTDEELERLSNSFCRCGIQ